MARFPPPVLLIFESSSHFARSSLLSPFLFLCFRIFFAMEKKRSHFFDNNHNVPSSSLEVKLSNLPWLYSLFLFVSRPGTGTGRKRRAGKKKKKKLSLPLLPFPAGSLSQENLPRVSFRGTLLERGYPHQHSDSSTLDTNPREEERRKRKRGKVPRRKERNDGEEQMSRSGRTAC